MKGSKLLLSAALLLLAAPAVADPGTGAWTDAPSYGSAGTGKCQRQGLNATGPACLYTITVQENSQLIYASSSFTVDFNANVATDGIAGNATIAIRKCIGPDFTAESCPRVDDLVLTGVPPLRGFTRLEAGTYYVEAVTGPAGQTAVVRFERD